MPYYAKPANAQAVLSCDLANADSLGISNSAVVSYADRLDGDRRQIVTNKVTTSADVTSEADRPLNLVALGVEDVEGNSLTGLGAIALDLSALFQQQGIEAADANSASIIALTQWASLLPGASATEVASIIKSAIAAEQEANSTAVAEISNTVLLSTLAGFGEFSLRSLDLTEAEIEQVSQAVIVPEGSSFSEQIRDTTEATAAELTRSAAQAQLTAVGETYEVELNKIRAGNQIVVAPGSQVKFKFRLDNPTDRTAEIELPNAQAITENGLTGSGTVTGVAYRLPAGEATEAIEITESEPVLIPKQTSLELEIEVEVGETSETDIASIEINLQPSCGTPAVQSLAILPPIETVPIELIDPLGQITGCAGELLPEYQGFLVAMYDIDPSDPTGSTPQNITPLTETELPDDPNNKIPKGITPNTKNSNPFFLTNSDEGRYSFLFDENRGQLDFGATYVLLVTPPEDSVYNERRVKLVIGEREGNIVEYTASSLDGRPISTQGGQTTVTGEIVLVEDAERVGLDLAVLDLSTNICDAQEIQITKTGDRATAEPGDIVLYRLAIRNLASAPINNLQITDTLPAGFKLEPDSIQAEFNEESVPLEVAQSGRSVNITSNITLGTDEVVNLVYAAQLTPNALRGSGENTAIVNARRIDNNNPVQDGPAIHTLLLEPGIVEDAGTLIGRVFVDKNFDGEQQQGEPGIPNAVIFLEDGNRVITDPEGMFSVTNVLPGIHTGTLDLTSIPEYRLAPNVRFIERNSKSRMVKLQPGGLVRMNFGVTPTATGEAEPSEDKPTKPKTPQPDTPPDTPELEKPQLEPLPLSVPESDL